MDDLISPTGDRLQQRKAQRLPTRKANLFVLRDFLTPQLCTELVDLIERDNRPSTIADDQGVALFRTSKTCDLSPTDRAVAETDSLICDCLGLDPALGEPLQGQKYDVGNEFRDHTDYFEPSGVDYLRYCIDTGQRIWTAMIFLNLPEAGGATRFKRLDKIIQPEIGKMIVWANVTPDGRPNSETLHAGMKVRSGTKYVITKWFRERPWAPAPVA
jgi:prolyl 4-hydroxylase